MTKLVFPKDHCKNCLVYAMMDTLDVVLWAGVPATGVTAYIKLFEDNAPFLVEYGALIASAVNVIVFFLKRFLDYYKRRREFKL